VGFVLVGAPYKCVVLLVGVSVLFASCRLAARGSPHVLKRSLVGGREVLRDASRRFFVSLRPSGFAFLGPEALANA
jgi:hypothetical protein